MTEWFYNIKTGEVEEGRQSIAPNFDGPFATVKRRRRAPEIIADRAAAWAAEDAEEQLAPRVLAGSQFGSVFA